MNEIETRLRSAVELARSGQLTEAEQALRSLDAEVPDSGAVAYWLGTVLLESARPADALPYLGRAARDGGNSQSHYAHGLALARLGSYQDAVQAFGAALQADAENLDALFNRARALKDLGRNTESAADYETYLGQRPDDGDALYNLANIRFEQNRLDDALTLFQQLVDRHPDHLDGYTNLALLLSQTGEPENAIAILERVLAVDPDHVSATRLLHSIQSRRLPGWHIEMLMDTARNQGYDDAIAKVAGKSEHVLDIGTGSGLLAMMAARAGAKHVTACEQMPHLAAVAETIVRDNGYADRIRILAKKSTDLLVGEDLPEPADLLITEIFDVGLLGEQFLPTVFHARESLLTADATIIPKAATVHAALIETEHLRPSNPISRISGFDMSAFDVYRRMEYRRVDLRALDHRTLSEPFDVARFEFETMSALGNEFVLSVLVTESGVFDGVAFWFTLELDDEIKLYTAAGAPCGHWGQALQMMPGAARLERGAEVRLICKQDLAGLVFHRAD